VRLRFSLVFTNLDGINPKKIDDMKKILLIIFILNAVFAYAQEPLEYTDVVYLKDSTISKNDIYNSTSEWFVKDFSSAKDVIQLNDKETGKIIAKGAYHISPTLMIGECWVNFTLTIMMKDGRFKYSFTDLYHTSAHGKSYDGGDINQEKADCSGMYMTKKAWRQIKEITEVSCYNSITRLTETIENNFKQNEEW